MSSSSEWNNEVDNVRVNTCENPWHNPAIILFPLWGYGRRGNDGDMIEYLSIAKFNFHFLTPLGVIFSTEIFGYFWFFLLIFGFLLIFWFLCWKRKIICSTSTNENIIFFLSDFFIGLYWIVFVWINFGRLWSMIKYRYNFSVQKNIMTLLSYRKS